MIPPLLEPDWPAPASVLALATTRGGGASGEPFASFNLGDHVGDDAAAVRANRDTLVSLLPRGLRVSWLEQVHGARVLPAAASGHAGEADAQYCTQPGLACAILTADCLPVLLCNRAGDRVAAAHAGWRGLAAGVLEATVATLDTAPADLLAWLGPAIGPGAFEVGAEVRQAFVDAAGPTASSVAACFAPGARAGHYLADLYALARLRLAAAGVSAVYGGGLCTYTDAQRFFSYRRDGRTGRMATLIALRP